MSITGVVPGEFEQYLPQFSAAYDQLSPQFADTQIRENREGALAQMEDKLLFIWLHDKMQTLPPALGLHFGLSLAQTHEWIDHLLPVLRLTLHNLTNRTLSANCVQFLQLLNSYQVEYLIVGGYAVAFHGYQRPLLDFDIFIATHPVNVQRLVQVLHAFGYGVAPQIVKYFQMKERVIRIGQPPFTIERFSPDERIIQIGVTPKELEILTAISAVTFEECYLERVAGVMDNVPVQIIGLPQLKRNKQASIRLKDADDLAHLC